MNDSRVRIVIFCGIALLMDSSWVWAGDAWKKHVVHSEVGTVNVVAADFTGDKKADIIANSGGKTRLFVAPDWMQVIIEDEPQHACIHAEWFDVDRDGDPDWIGARYGPGLVYWLERPDHPLEQAWKFHLIDDQIEGVHGLIKGDVDGDGRLDLLANSGQPAGRFPNSLAWLKGPSQPRAAERWQRYIFADGDAPGLSHYLGFGDVDADGRPDAATAAKGGPTDKTAMGNWFAWWQAPKDPKKPWKKHLLADNQAGATNIHPVDLNGDGKTDFIASRGHGRGVIWFEAPRWTIHDIHATLKEPHCLVVADFDEDGDPDAATCGFGDKEAWWFENNGKGRFTNHLIGRDQESYDIRAVDLDNDGDLDVLIAGRGSNNVVWYENPFK